LKAEIREELERIEAMGGAVAAIESSYMKQALVQSNSLRMNAIEAGALPLIGVNMFAESAPSPLTGGDGAILTVDDSAERDQIEHLTAWRAGRDEAAVKAAIAGLAAAAKEGRNIM